MRWRFHSFESYSAASTVVVVMVVVVVGIVVTFVFVAALRHLSVPCFHTCLGFPDFSIALGSRLPPPDPRPPPRLPAGILLMIVRVAFWHSIISPLALHHYLCPLTLISRRREKVRDSEITAEVVEQLKQVGPKISGIIEANGEGDAGMLEALFKVCLLLQGARFRGLRTGIRDTWQSTNAAGNNLVLILTKPHLRRFQAMEIGRQVARSQSTRMGKARRCRG